MSGHSYLPASPSDLSAEWIGSVLARSGVIEDALGLDMAIEQIAEGRGFVGRSVRCRLSYPQPGMRGPRSVIAKFPAEHERKRAIFAEAGLYEREVRFYRELASECGVPVPACYFAQIEPDGRFLLLLEDLAPGLPGDPLSGCTTAQANQALQHAAVMHARWWGSPRLDELEWLPPADPPRILDAAARMYEPAWESFVARAGKHIPAGVVRTGEKLRRSLPQLLGRLSQPPRTLVHGDYQLGNVFFDTDGRLLAVTDWQVIIKARAPMDVSHFLVRSLTADDRRHAERELLVDYHQRLCASGVSGYTFDECWDDYRLATLSQLGLGVLLSHGLSENGDNRPGEAARDALAAVVGARLMTAVEDLRPLEVLEPRRGWGVPFLRRGR